MIDLLLASVLNFSEIEAKSVDLVHHDDVVLSSQEFELTKGTREIIFVNDAPNGLYFYLEGYEYYLSPGESITLYIDYNSFMEYDWGPQLGYQGWSGYLWDYLGGAYDEVYVLYFYNDEYDDYLYFEVY